MFLNHKIRFAAPSRQEKLIPGSFFLLKKEMAQHYGHDTKKNLARPIYLRFSQQTDKRTSICTVSPLSALACNKYFIEQKKKERKLK
jgi:hypothetical protein